MSDNWKDDVERGRVIGTKQLGLNSVPVKSTSSMRESVSPQQRRHSRVLHPQSTLSPQELGMETAPTRKHVKAVRVLTFSAQAYRRHEVLKGR